MMPEPRREVIKGGDPLQLQEFVAESLAQIINGVVNAQRALKDSGGQVNPKLHSLPASQDVYGVVREPDLQPVQLVEFDVAVNAIETKGSKSGIGVLVAAVGLGMEAQSGRSSGSESRLKFKIPVMLPTHTRSQR
jgi:hypothetical protein